MASTPVGGSLRNDREPGIWRMVWSSALIFLVIGYYITGSVTWGYESRWLQWRYVKHRLLDTPPHLTHFSEQELALYNGIDKSRPIYVAVDGMVFDVSSRPDTYGPIGAYHFFSGIDAARAFATGCFATDLTHDLRGLTEQELLAVEGWQRFFNTHTKYWHVGYVEHPPASGPPPVHCKGQQKP